MPKNYYEVKLSNEEIEKLKAITHKGVKSSTRTIMHTNILLNTNDGLAKKKKNNREIAELFDISPTTVNQIRKLYATQGLEEALNRKAYLADPAFSKITEDF